MPTFLWKAKNADEREIVERIEAENASAARKVLEARGLTDLRLLTEEAMEIASRGAVEATQAKYHVDLTAKQEAAYLEGRGPGFWRLWGTVIVKQLHWILISSVLLWVILPKEERYWVVISLVPILLYPFIDRWFGRPGRLYDELTTATSQNRWADVLRLAEQLEESSSVVGIGIPEWELARHRGMALAGLGRLDEGIETYRQAAKNSRLEDWLTYSHLSEIFTVAGRHADSLALKQKAADAQPSNMTPLIDLAMHHVHYMGDAVRARKVLDRIDRTLVVELGRPYLELIEAMILCEEGHFVRALSPLEGVQVRFESMNQSGPFEGMILLTRSYLCLAFASAGRMEEAISHWTLVEKHLVAAKEERLLNRIRRVI